MWNHLYIRIETFASSNEWTKSFLLLLWKSETAHWHDSSEAKSKLIEVFVYPIPCRAIFAFFHFSGFFSVCVYVE